MRARDIVGRKVVAINQAVRSDPNHPRTMHLGSLVLDNGTLVTFSVRELEDDYAVVATAYKQKRKRPRRGSLAP